jgi:hypothetical protein
MRVRVCAFKSSGGGDSAEPVDLAQELASYEFTHVDDRQLSADELLAYKGDISLLRTQTTICALARACVSGRRF